MSDAERTRFVRAIQTMKTMPQAEVTGPGGIAVSTYEKYIVLHAQNAATAHGFSSFLPWHREFLRRFEADLQAADRQNGNDGNIGILWWNWTVDRSADPTAKRGHLWKDDFMGPSGSGPELQVLSGPFASWRVSFSSPTFLRRDLGVQATIPSSSDLKTLQDRTPYDASPWTIAASTGYRNWLEGFIGPGFHNEVHVWVGGENGQMSIVAQSPTDPCFWLHHCNVDRIWAEWQDKHPSEGYLPTSGGSSGQNLDDPMPPWTTAADTRRPRDVLNHRSLGYVYSSGSSLTALFD